MATPLDDLYREVILDHAKRPRGVGLREPFTVEVHRVNPTCGDEVTLRIQLSSDGRRIDDLSYDSLGCSISIAAASVLADGVTGGSVDSALAAYDRFHALVTGAVGPASGAGRGRGCGEAGVADDAEDMDAFAGVARFPTRVKCALLAWTAAREALVRADG
jgi:nitrogen fixation NifU-like protein